MEQNETSEENPIARLEALLFVHGEPLSLKKIATALGTTEAEALELTDRYRDILKERDGGISLSSDGKNEKVQLVTKPEFSKILEDFVKEELREDLSPASLETLSVIAYLGPISRARIEYVRGVNCSFILRSLLLRGLIEKNPDPNQGGGVIYGLSMECVRYLGIESPADLPEYDRFKGLETTQEVEPAEESSENKETPPEGSMEQPA